MRKNNLLPSYIYQKRERKRLKRLSRFQQKAQKRPPQRSECYERDLLKLPPEAKLAHQLENLANVDKFKYKIKHGTEVTFKIPKQFNIYKNPKKVFETLAQFRKVALDPQVRVIKLNHFWVDSCLASEALLGILANEINVARLQLEDKSLNFKGLINDSHHTQFKLIQHAGLISELKGVIENTNEQTRSDKVLVYKRDNRLNHSASSTAEDIKNETASACVRHLKNCLKTQSLLLNDDVANDLEMSLGELLDNVHEHCGTTAPYWYVRSYLDTECEEKRHFDLMVMNLGNSIADTFLNLPDSSMAKEHVMVYADRHSQQMDLEPLITVAALQGNVSSKKDQESTRGQGTIRLIEMFETIYEDYVTLRGNNHSGAVMNLISGSTIITFDGKYKSIKTDNSDGSEDVKIAFNSQNSLRYPPDASVVSHLKDICFPGVMLNIRIPLTGSTKPLSADK